MNAQRQFLELGFKTRLVCINADLLGPHFAGKLIDKELLSQLPSEVDPCGENGEFHTFVFDGSMDYPGAGLDSTFSFTMLGLELKFGEVYQGVDGIASKA